MEKERADQPELRLRGEARSVWLDTLAADQQRVFEKLINLIDAARLDLPTPDEWSKDPTFDRGLDERSTSRVLLLGGGRGSGKTTVASTLQKALSGGSELYNKEHKLTASQERLQLTVDDLRPNVIVLEPLSMEDTPSESNVLAALLARIEQLLFPKLTHEDTPSTTGDQRQHGAVLELLRLQTDVAIAWNGNLGERKGQLDPDNYAMEELRVERVRLQLRDRFATVLRRTARDSLGHKKRPALFLLIVDDADVNPAKLMDLLERLRMVAVVEFVVLLVGDIGAIDAAFRLHFANRFRLDERRQIEPDKIGMDPKEMSSLTNSIGRSALRKHVPYHQRVLLQPLKARETVGLSPLRRTRRPLAEMLSSLAVSYPAVPHRSWISGEEHARLSSPESANRADQGDVTSEEVDELEQTRTTAAHRMTLKTFIYPEAEIQQDSGENSWYVGSRILADSPRVAIDLWNTLRDAKSGESGVQDVWANGGSIREGGAQSLDPRLHTLFRQLAAERLDAKTDLWLPNSPINDALRETIVRDGNLDALDLVGTHHVDYVGDTPRRLVCRANEDDLVYWSRHDGLQFEVMGKPASRREIGPLVLVEDLWSLENRTAAEQAAAERRRSELIWVVSQNSEAREKERQRLTEEKAAARAAVHGSAQPSKDDEDDEPNPPRRRGTPWPVPMYRTTRQVEQFGYAWNAFLSWWEGDPNRSTDELVDAWIACHTRSLLGGEPARYTAAQPDASDAPNDVVLSLADGVAETKESLLDLADFLAGDDEWAATIACDWLASVGWLLERARGSSLQLFLGEDFLEDHPVCRERINTKITELKVEPKSSASDGTG